MSDNRNQNNKVYNENDTWDVNELVALEKEVTPDLIEALQTQAAQTAESFSRETASGQSDDDSELFEEVPTPQIQELPQEPENSSPESDSDLGNKQGTSPEEDIPVDKNTQNTSSDTESQTDVSAKEDGHIENKEIELLTNGNIIEKPITPEQLEYNKNLDYLDENTKYNKYVIYIAPENIEFIESLTVKERKNLINKILREQDDIALTKRKLATVQTVIKHIVVAVITLLLAVPAIYITINASLEATINNYKQSQSIFKTLYKEHGKIKATENLR